MVVVNGFSQDSIVVAQGEAPVRQRAAAWFERLGVAVRVSTCIVATLLLMTLLAAVVSLLVLLIHDFVDSRHESTTQYITTAGRKVSAGLPLYKDPNQRVNMRVVDLLARMTLDEKIGQITQIERNVSDDATLTNFKIGTILSISA